MVCLECGHKMRVVNSRSQARSNQVWRRRQCLGCGAIFSTYEQFDYRIAWVVKDAAGRLAPFSRDKLFLSVYSSCQHRPTAITDAAGLADTIISKLRSHASAGVINAQLIVQIATVALNRFDRVASTHYQAFHRL